MKFVSTRGGISSVTFEEALFSGYAADGGLLVGNLLFRLLFKLGPRRAPESGRIP
jgi:hypothetical protein